MICPGCANPISPMEKLLGKCAKDGGPLTGRRETLHISGEALEAAKKAQVT